MWSCPEKRNRFQFQASKELFYKMQGKKSTQGIMNNAPLPASLSHILEVGNTVFVVVSRVSVCCCWAITSQNHLFPLPFLVYFYFQRMGLWSRAVDRKAFSKPPATLEILGLAGVPFLPHFLCLQYWDLPNTWCRCSGGSPGPFSDPFAMAVKVRGLYTGPAFLLRAIIKSSRWSEALIDLSPLNVTEDVCSIPLPTAPNRQPDLSFRQLSVWGNEEAELLQSPVNCEYSVQEESALNLI